MGMPPPKPVYQPPSRKYGIVCGSCYQSMPTDEPNQLCFNCGTFNQIPLDTDLIENWKPPREPFNWQNVWFVKLWNTAIHWCAEKWVWSTYTRHVEALLEKQETYKIKAVESPQGQSNTALLALISSIEGEIEHRTWNEALRMNIAKPASMWDETLKFIAENEHMHVASNPYENKRALYYLSQIGKGTISQENIDCELSLMGVRKFGDYINPILEQTPPMDYFSSIPDEGYEQAEIEEDVSSIPPLPQFDYRLISKGWR